MKTIRTLFSLLKNKQIFATYIKGKGLQVILFLSYVITILMPIIFREDFSVKKYCWLAIGKNQAGDLILNIPFVTFLPLCLIIAMDHFFNFRGKIVDKSQNILTMIGNLTNEIPKLQRLCEMGFKISEYSDNPKFARKKLQQCLSKCLMTFNKFIHAYVDTVSKDAIITSNVMASLRCDDFISIEEYDKATASFEEHNIYKSYSSDNNDQIGWLTMVVSCKESKKRFNLGTFTMKLMDVHCDALVGAPDAWHIGNNITEDDDFEYDISYVNDVKSIEFNTNNKQLQDEANAHFRKLKVINSFVSAPIIYENIVVGVYNVNSSEKLLAGINKNQRAILQLLLSLFTQTVARCLMLWRKYEFNTKA